MFGNLVNNRQLQQLLKQGVIEIEPYEDDNQSLAHYGLHIRKIKKHTSNGQLRTIRDFIEEKEVFELEPNAFVVVQIQEVIKLHDDGIVGQFIPTSNLIEEGLCLVAGKIDKKYGTHNLKRQQEMIQFGLKNLTDRIVKIEPFHRVAHLCLYDLRGVASVKIELSETDKLVMFRRFLRDYNDGPIPKDDIE